jgi:hypothetical protein
LSDIQRALVAYGDPASRVTSLRQSGALAPARRLDRQLGSREPSRVLTEWRAVTTAAYTLGVQIAAYDREMRRAAEIVRVRGRLRDLPTQLPLRDGRLIVAEAGVGSLDLLLEAVGVLSMVLLSDPVQLLLTADALLGKVRNARAFLNRRADPLASVSAREALEVLRAFGSSDMGEPDTQIIVSRGEKQALDRQPKLGTQARATLVTDQFHAEGGRITHVRIRDDGTADIVVIE